MQTSLPSIRIVGLAFAIAGGVVLSGCTTSSGFTSLANQTVPTAAKVVETSLESAATPAVPTPVEPMTPVPATQIAGIPAPVEDAPARIAPSDPVAIPKPVLASATAPAPVPASSPEVIRTVPRTPVVNRPTNQIMMVRTTAYTHSESDHVQYGRKSAAGNTLKYGSQVRSAAADWSKYPL
jgi:hypothetical protein